MRVNGLKKKRNTKKNGKSIEMLQCLTGLCSRRQDRGGGAAAKHQTASLAFVFRVRERAVPTQAQDLCMYAGCRCIGEFIFYFFPSPAVFDHFPALK